MNQPIELLHGHKFITYLPDEQPGNRIFTLVSATTDRVTGDITLCRAHALSTLTLQEAVATTAGVTKRIQFYLYSRNSDGIRRIAVTYFGTTDWYPLALDALDSGVAIETITLVKPVYYVEDIRASDCDEELQAALSPYRGVAVGANAKQSRGGSTVVKHAI